MKLVERRGPTSVYIDAEITKTGDVLISGQDVGEAPKQAFGSSDYEYFLTIPAAEKDRLILELLSALYTDDDRAVSKLKERLDAAGITAHFHTQ